MNTKITMAGRLVRLISQINSEQMAPINVPTVRTINLIQHCQRLSMSYSSLLTQKSYFQLKDPSTQVQQQQPIDHVHDYTNQLIHPRMLEE